MRSLLDVNVMLALLDAGHVFHARAHLWWSSEKRAGWASCPLTENAVLRIMTQAAYSQSRRFSIAEVLAALTAFTSGTNHQFWPDDLSLRDPAVFQADRIHGPRQLTDLYLLALASARGGRLVTFDRSIPLSAVRSAKPRNLLVI